MEDLGHLNLAVETKSNDSGWKKHAQRNAWRTFRRYGIGWKVPLSVFHFTGSEGEVLEIPYIAPKDILQFLLKQHPDILFGEVRSGPGYALQLKEFWAAYQQQHEGHQIFDSESGLDTAYTLPLLVHGDEGRGKRRTNTFILFLETPFGLGEPLSSASSRKRKRRDQSGCAPPQKHLEKFKQGRNVEQPTWYKSVLGMRTNTKGNCFLQRWPLVVVPGVVYKAHPTLLYEIHKLVGLQLKALYYEGFHGPNGRSFFGSIIGIKGDMKYHTQVGKLTRSYEHQGVIRDLPCCHECLGGTPTIPWEDCSERPIWEASMFTTRPWDDAASPPLLSVPFDRGAPEEIFRKDPFHIGKVGVMRDVIGSILFWCVELGYFGQGDVPTKLQSAHGSFRLYCHSTGQHPSLRSFTKALFMYKSRKSFPWSNTKGSDSVLLLKWIRVSLKGFIQDPTQDVHLEVLELMHSTVSAALSYYNGLYSHGLFLSRPCAVDLYLNGRRFIAGFNLLAQKFLGQRNLFAVKPKLHMWVHCLVEIRQALERGSFVVSNPLTYNCEGNEDAIGRISRLSRRLDSRGVSSRTLQCSLVQAHLAHRRFKGIG